jgi:hypothetical protein
MAGDIDYESRARGSTLIVCSAVRGCSEADPAPRTTNTGHLMLPDILQSTNSRPSVS